MDAADTSRAAVPRQYAMPVQPTLPIDAVSNRTGVKMGLLLAAAAAFLFVLFAGLALFFGLSDRIDEIPSSGPELIVVPSHPRAQPSHPPIPGARVPAMPEVERAFSELTYPGAEVLNRTNSASMIFLLLRVNEPPRKVAQWYEQKLGVRQTVGAGTQIIIKSPRATVLVSGVQEYTSVIVREELAGSTGGK